MRALAEGIARAAIQAVDPCRAVMKRWPAELNRAERVYAVAIGKASIGMAYGARQAIGPRLKKGIVLCPPEVRDQAAALDGFEAHACDHPVPSERNVHASERVEQLVLGMGPGDMLLVLVSGGGSAHLTLPGPGVTLERVQDETKALLRRGVAIGEMNRSRAEIERLKAGGLAALALERGAEVRALAVSDVVGDDPAVIASGPTVPGAEPLIVANRQDAAGGAAEWLRARGWTAQTEPDAVAGDVTRACVRLATAARALEPGMACVLSGETTVDARRANSGRGGRCRELALRLLVELDRDTGVWWVAFGTDGVDGMPEGGRAVAGAWAHAGCLARAREAGLDVDAALARHDSGPVWAAMGQELTTGVTGTNVGDVLVLGREHAVQFGPSGRLTGSAR